MDGHIITVYKITRLNQQPNEKAIAYYEKTLAEAREFAGKSLDPCEVTIARCFQLENGEIYVLGDRAYSRTERLVAIQVAKAKLTDDELILLGVTT